MQSHAIPSSYLAKRQKVTAWWIQLEFCNGTLTTGMLTPPRNLQIKKRRFNNSRYLFQVLMNSLYLSTPFLCSFAIGLPLVTW